MKLHLPTRLRAALVAAMVVVTSAPAFATDYDSSAAVYDNVKPGYVVTLESSGTKSTDGIFKNQPVPLPAGKKLADIAWDMVVVGEGYNDWNSNIFFKFGEGNFSGSGTVSTSADKTWLESHMTEGFALMLDSGYVLVGNPIIQSWGGPFTDDGPLGEFPYLLAKELKKSTSPTNIKVELSYTPTMAVSGTTYSGGTLNFTGGSVTVGKETTKLDSLTLENVKMPDISNTAFMIAGTKAGTGLPAGAKTTVAIFLKDSEGPGWTISGLTSLQKLRGGGFYEDKTTLEHPTLVSSDTIYLTGKDGVLFTDEDAEVNNSVLTTVDKANINVIPVLGLGAAAGKTLTLNKGGEALLSAAAGGLRIVGEGTVKLAGNNTDDITVSRLTMDDGATLNLARTSGVTTFEMDGTGTGAQSTLIVSADSTMNLQALKGATVKLGEVSTQSSFSTLMLTGKGTFDIGTANISYVTEVGNGATLKAATIAGGTASSLTIYEGAHLQAHDVTVGSLGVQLTSVAVDGTLSTASFGMGTDIVRFTIDGKNAGHFTATNVSTAYDRKSFLTADSLANANIRMVAANKTQVEIKGDTTETAVNIRGTGFEYITTIDTVSTSGSLLVDNTHTAVTGDVTARGVTLEDYAFGVKGKLGATAVAAKGAAELAVGGDMGATTLSAANTAAVAVGGDLNASTSIALENAATLSVDGNLDTATATMSGTSAARVGGTANLTTLTMSGDTAAAAGKASVGTLTMSEGATLAAKELTIGHAGITIPTLARVANQTTMDHVVMTDAVLGTTSGTASSIVAEPGQGGSVVLGEGYTLSGVTQDGSAAALDVATVSLGDEATLQNFAVGGSTVMQAAGTQHFDAMDFAGGYKGLSLDGIDNYISVTDTVVNGLGTSSLDSLTMTGTADASKLALDFLTINGEGLLFVDGTWTDYVLFNAADGVSIDFDCADTYARQFNITPFTYAELSKTTDGAGREQIVISGREAKDEIMAALRSTANRDVAMTELARAVDEEGATDMLKAVYNNTGDIYHFTEQQRQATLSAASGASLANLTDAQRRGVEDIQKSLRNRIVQMGGAEDGIISGWDKGNIQTWAQADGAYHTLSQNEDIAGYNFDVWGATLGANVDITSHWTAGIALSAEYGSLSGKGSDALDADTESYYVNFYGRYQKGHWTNIGIFTIGMSNVDTERTVLGTKGEGSTSGTSFSGYYELGYLMPMDDEGRHLLQPIFNLSVTSAKLDGFSETGAIGNAGLNYGSQDLFYGNVGLGARYQAVLYRTVGAFERNAVLELRGQLNQHFGDSTDEAEVSFIGGGKQFAVHGAESGDFGVQLGAGLSVPVGVQTTLYGDVDGEFRSKQTDVRANIGVRYDF